ncbi:MAG TPA: magnesium chelatase domain-containing protein, partial [Candidatus Aminicenantes bacterium]|nr:magnesium chelatase domain-containing protein [Candidatus Aminicenantes bacterium]
VMKESAIAALSFIKAHSAGYGLAVDFFKEKTVHIHVPEGAIPKDGPSAGVTMLSSMLSTFTGKPVRKEVAMTGEITLQGRVLPVGGIKSKVLAAQRAGIEEIILPAFNKKDLDDIPKNIRRHLRFVFVEEAAQVLEAALIDPSLPPDKGRAKEPKEDLPSKRRGRPPKAKPQEASPATAPEKAEEKVHEGLPERKTGPSRAKGSKPSSEGKTPPKEPKKRASGKGAKKRPKPAPKASEKLRKGSGEKSGPSKKENP